MFQFHDFKASWMRSFVLLSLKEKRKIHDSHCACAVLSEDGTCATFFLNTNQICDRNWWDSIWSSDDFWVIGINAFIYRPFCVCYSSVGGTGRKCTIVYSFLSHDNRNFEHSTTIFLRCETKTRLLLYSWNFCRSTTTKKKKIDDPSRFPLSGYNGPSIITVILCFIWYGPKLICRSCRV